MNDAKPFWEKPLEQLDRGEWEALCDSCGRCCLHKLEDEETGELFATNVACKLLDRRNGRCVDYLFRKKHVEDCVVLDRAKLDRLDWLPDTCAYRLRANGRAAAGLALSGLGKPRDGSRGRPVDARLDGQRGRCRRARISSGRPWPLTGSSGTPTCRCRSCLRR